MPRNPHPSRRMRPDQSFIGRALRDVWGHFNSELLAGIKARYPHATTATNQLMLMIDVEGTTVSELARRVGVTKQAMADSVQALESQGLVTREPHDRDRRARLVTLTDEGYAALQVGLEVVTAMHERWSDLLGDDNMSRLFALLRRLAERLDEPADQQPSSRHPRQPDP
jgi:DNA-binding MarR family transcriptional regulator